MVNAIRIPISKAALCLAIYIAVQRISHKFWQLRGIPATAKQVIATLSEQQPFANDLSPEFASFTHKKQLKSPLPQRRPRNSNGTHLARRWFYLPHLTRELPTLCPGALRYSDHEQVRASVSNSEIQSAFEQLAGKYLAPWIPLSSNRSTPQLARPITRKLLNSMEVLIRGGAFRIRLAGDGTIRYRVLEHWGQTYRISRMTWTMDLLQEAMRKYPELKKLKCEFYVNVADSPRSTVDSMSRDMGGIPVFSFRTSTAYLDIPVPDPVEYGSNGNYVWQTEETLPYQKRISKLVFRGSASSLHDYHDDNWLPIPRVRLAALAKLYPNFIDGGITKWMKLAKGTNVQDIAESLGTGIANELSYEEQGKYKFILDLDGGLGSSRKRGILGSGSVPFFHRSNWYTWYEPLLKPFYHFIPVETYLHDLLDKIKHAREDTMGSLRIVERAKCFAGNVVTREAAMLFWRILLERYSQLQDENDLTAEDVTPSMCSLRPATAEGPMGCSDGWYTYNGSVPFGCRYVGAKRHPFSFECWRNIGRGLEFKFTHDPVHSPYNSIDP